VYALVRPEIADNQIDRAYEVILLSPKALQSISGEGKITSARPGGRACADPSRLALGVILTFPADPQIPVWPE